MTIAISIQTSTAVVFAADSRLTTYGRAGFDTNGEPIVVPQTYENATKVVRDQSNTAMVVVTGSASLGRISFMDYIASSVMSGHSDVQKHDEAIRGFAEGMALSGASLIVGRTPPLGGSTTRSTSKGRTEMSLRCCTATTSGL